ncbi:MAG: amidohydrolase family protein [Desulfarculaceae bacterium]|jgi:imidazolonepropionase-like amidohydrolase
MGQVRLGRTGDRPVCLKAKGVAGAYPPEPGQAAVLISQGRIKALGAGAWEDKSAIRLDLPHLWLCPAPLDAHVHLWLKGGPAQNLAASAEAGLAAVRDLGRPAQAEALTETPEPPPLLVQAGMGLGARGEGGSWLAQGLEGAEQFARAAWERAQEGNQVVKVFATGLLDFENPGQVLSPLAVSAPELSAAVRAAHRCGLKVVVHGSGVPAAEAALKAKADCLEHGYFLNADIFKQMAAQPMTWTPTLAAVKAHARDPEKRHEPRVRANLKAIAQGQMQAMRQADSLGVKLVLGTDAGSYGLAHGQAVFLEMQAWLEAGISAQVVFKAATSRAAQALGLEGEVGEIRVGARAWLLGVRQDPRESPLAMKDPEWRSF